MAVSYEENLVWTSVVKWQQLPSKRQWTVSNSLRLFSDYISVRFSLCPNSTSYITLYTFPAASENYKTRNCSQPFFCSLKTIHNGHLGQRPLHLSWNSKHSARILLVVLQSFSVISLGIKRLLEFYNFTYYNCYTEENYQLYKMFLLRNKHDCK